MGEVGSAAQGMRATIYLPDCIVHPVSLRHRRGTCMIRTKTRTCTSTGISTNTASVLRYLAQVFGP